MSKKYSLGAAASLALAAAAFAQPASFTDLGDHSLSNNTGSTSVTLVAANDIQWYKIILPGVTSTQGFVDLWTNGPGNMLDTEIGVYDNAGAMKANDDDDGPSNGSALSFGKTTPTRAGTAAVAPFTTAGAAYNGRDGVLGTGTYWIAVGRFNVTFNASAWSVTSTYTGTERTTTLFWNIEIPGSPTNPTGVAVHSPTNGLAGSSFTTTCTVTPGAFPTSTGITVSADASAVGAGTVALLDNGVPPDVTANDNIFTATITTSGATTPGVKAINYTVSDAQARSSNNSANYTINSPPPANDTCATATTAVVGANPFDNSAATNDGLAVCVTSSKDVWFSFTPAQSGQMDLSMCGGASFDTVLAVFDGCGGTQIACNDDSCGLQSQITGLTLNGGSTYYIRLAGFGGASAGGAGNMNLNYTVDTPPSGVGANITGAGGSAGLMTVTVTPGTNPASTGLTVTADTTSIGGAPGTAFYDDGTNGDVTANDNIFSLNMTFPSPDAVRNVTFTVADAQARSTGGSFNVTTSTPPSWTEVGDAGDLPASAQAPEGSGSLNSIEGAISSGDVADMYRINICDFANFSATTNHVVTGAQDTQLFLFDSFGNGVQMNDDGAGVGLNSTMHNEFVTANGNYYIAVSHYDNDPMNSGGSEIWLDQPFGTVRAPDNGQSDIAPASWSGATTTTFSYRIVFTGTCFPGCAADFNNDGVVDFFDYLDFVDAFANNDPIADFNQDGVIDFFDYLDFVDAFSQGC